MSERQRLLEQRLLFDSCQDLVNSIWLGSISFALLQHPYKRLISCKQILRMLPFLQGCCTSSIPFLLFPRLIFNPYLLLWLLTLGQVGVAVVVSKEQKPQGGYLSVNSHVRGYKWIHVIIIFILKLFNFFIINGFICCLLALFIFIGLFPMI